jgi:hypothetical protein
MPHPDFCRRRGVPAFTFVGVDGRSFEDAGSYLRHLAEELPESYLAGRDFGDYAALLQKVAAGEMTAEQAGKQVPTLRRVGGSCPCSRAVRWVVDEPRLTDAPTAVAGG